MTRTRFQSILQNLHFSYKDNDDKTDKSYKIRPVIEYLNKVFAESLLNGLLQSINKHMCRFKGRSSLKQHIKNKPIKWGFKYWYRCDSERGYVYQLELYQGRKKDNKSVMLLGSHLDEITSISTVQRKLKGSSSKIPVNCPNSIKLYNSKMDGVDLMDQLKSAYQLDRRLKFGFCFRFFFYLFDVALVDSFIVYKKLENKDLTLKEFKICIALKSIASFVSRKLSCPNYRPSKNTKAERPGPIPPSHLL